MANHIVSMSPAATEIILSLRHEDELVGRSHLCDMSPKVRSLPAVTEADASPQGFRIRFDVLRSLNPTLIITPTVFDASEISPKTIVFLFTPSGLTDITASMAAIGDKLKDPEPATKAVGKFTGKAATVSMKTLMFTSRPTIACIEQVNPLMLGGLWVPEMIETAGGTPVLTQKGQPSKRITIGELHAADPDILLFHLRPSDRSAPSIATLLGQSEWALLRSVKEGKAAIAKPYLFNRPGPRLAEGIEVLAEVLHPGKFNTAHQGRLWSWV